MNMCEFFCFILLWFGLVWFSWKGVLSQAWPWTPNSFVSAWWVLGLQARATMRFSDPYILKMILPTQIIWRSINGLDVESGRGGAKPCIAVEKECSTWTFKNILELFSWLFLHTPGENLATIYVISRLPGTFEEDGVRPHYSIPLLKMPSVFLSWPAAQPSEICLLPPAENWVLSSSHSSLWVAFDFPESLLHICSSG